MIGPPPRIRAAADERDVRREGRRLAKVGDDRRDDGAPAARERHKGRGGRRHVAELRGVGRDRALVPRDARALAAVGPPERPRVRVQVRRVGRREARRAGARRDHLRKRLARAAALAPAEAARPAGAGASRFIAGPPPIAKCAL